MGIPVIEHLRAPSALLIALMLVSCGAGTSSGNQPSQAASTSPSLAALSLPRGTAVIHTASGDKVFGVEIAMTEAAREQGLMGVEYLPPNQGMVFSRDVPSGGYFWMKDTLIPLSIAFWDAEGKIIAVMDMEPCETDPCLHYEPPEPFLGALEVNQGELKGVAPGDTVEVVRAVKR